MTRRIRLAVLDIFKTALTQTDKVESPYRTVLQACTGAMKGVAVEQLRRRIMTSPMGLQDIVDTVEKKGLFHGNMADVADSVTYGNRLLAMQKETCFARNPELDAFIAMARDNGLEIAMISDLAMPYGAIADHHLSDIETKLYSFETHSLKAEGDPYYLLSRMKGVRFSEMVMIGDNLKSDVETPKELGMNAFWYRPDPARYSKYDRAMYQDDSITALPQALTTLKARGYILG